MLEWIALVELLLCWIVWAMAFIRPRREAADRKEVAKSGASVWGIGLVMAAYALTFTYVRPRGFHKTAPALIAGMILAPPCVVLAWTAASHLGRQWRYAAALREDHELIQTGPYRRLRHPIYASMFGMLLATGLCWTWWPQFAVAVVFFVIGTEIRVRSEERLLESHFGDRYRDYRARTDAWIPFLR
ncbi:MAG TPA: isoprenylcysteine carboxylmethyltransferase family protein [Acidobacteriaceae bacterium]|nr:isoprenylcysteine carboxylmethyltransferase family protein [Acidobacteriaceae bacterium]